MKRKKFELEWFVYVHGFICNGFRKMNIFNHFKFEKYAIKHLKECSTKEEFAERISRELFYYFGSKCEYELIITRRDNKITLSPWMGNKDGILDVTDDTDFNWNGFYEKMEQRYAFEKGKSFITNAQIHRNKRFVINVDLENFFDSFHFGRVRGYFMKNKNYQCTEEVATTIAQIVCYEGKLPQGAPSSPIITNMICNIFDMRLLRLAKKYKLDYTRYADDLSFSTNNKQFIDIEKQFFEELTQEIEHAGFTINDKKTRVQYKDSHQEVTGIVVNKKLSVD